MSLRGAFMVCGTSSDAGKTRTVAGLCRLLSDMGVDVAPFKGQNMALNSFVTPSGHEIARSQAHQAAAARTTPSVEMNPVLLKPSGDMRSQLVVMGRPVCEVAAGHYMKAKPALRETVLQALDVLRDRHEVVVAEGAGGAAEINLLEGDIVNVPLARAAGIPVLVVGDIERGGVFASIYGTVALLPDDLRSCIGGFLINKMRGDAGLLVPGVRELEHRTGLPCLGIVPHVGGLVVDAEDSLALENRPLHGEGDYEGEPLDVAVVHLPHIANFTDFDPLLLEPGVAVRFVRGPAALGNPDLVILPGSKATVADLAWLRQHHLDRAVRAAHDRGSSVLGICAGYQMLGTVIVDYVESRTGDVPGLGLLSSGTTFQDRKFTRQRTGVDAYGNRVQGYEVHHGAVTASPSATRWFTLEDGSGFAEEGEHHEDKRVYGTSLHGLFENDGFRRSFLRAIAEGRNRVFVAGDFEFEACRQMEIDKMAATLRAHVDVSRIIELATSGGPV
jgi:adenosylcobyric acid synthase